MEQANQFLRERYVAEFNRRFQVAAAQRGNAFVPCRSRDLELVFSVQSERAVNRDNTVSFQNHAAATGTGGLERHPGRLPRDGAPASGWNLSLTHGPHGWDVSTRRARLWRRPSRRRKGLWKRRGLEKSKRRLSHPAWKSRKVRGIPTFPPPRRRLVKLLNRTYHVLQNPDILTCYGQCGK